MYLPPDPPLTLGALSGMTRPGDGADPWGDALFFGSGRAALLAGLTALGVSADDEVLLPAYLCESVVTPVEALGARPVFYPVSRTLGVDGAALDAAIGPRARAVVLIHYLGFPGPVEEVRAKCERRGLALIEDCAHALYSRPGDRPLGSFGDLAIFSPWKSLPLPDGGLLALNRPVISQRRPAPSAVGAQTARQLAYRALGAVEQAVGWSPRLALLQRPGLRRATARAGQRGPGRDGRRLSRSRGG